MARLRSFPVSCSQPGLYAKDGIHNRVGYVYEQRNRQVGRHGTSKLRQAQTSLVTRALSRYSKHLPRLARLPG